MKININYELMDTIRSSQKGFSLKKFKTVMLLTNSLVIPLVISTNTAIGEGATETIKTILWCLSYSGMHNTLLGLANAPSNKQKAIENLQSLIPELNRHCIETDMDLITATENYKTKYSLNFDSFPPRIIQSKYLAVPVHNDFGNNERFLVQEHFIGDRTYTLSLGEPKEKQKVFFLQKQGAYK